MRIDGPVVVALDGSEHSAQTLRWGAQAAARRGAALVVAHVATVPVGPWTWSGAAPVPPDEDALADELRDACRTVVHSHPELTVSAVILRGATVPALTELSRDAQLLVTGARADRGPVLTVSAALSWRARCPVALVRPRAQCAPGGDDPGGPVVVGVDDSPESWLAAGLAAREAGRRGVPLHVLHAAAAATSPADRLAALDLATDLADTYPALTVRTVLVDDDPVSALVAASRTAGLLVVGARRLRLSRRLVGRRVARLASCPVLVVRDEPWAAPRADRRARQVRPGMDASGI